MVQRLSRKGVEPSGSKREARQEKKTCTQCHEEKPVTAFVKDKNKRSGRREWCRVCNSAWQRYYKYGLTPSAYESLLEGQGRACAICRESLDDYVKRQNRYKNFAVDHDHESGAVRGLLCDGCNLGLGKFNDDPALIRKAIDYLLSR